MYNSILEIVGCTPMLRLKKLEQQLGLTSQLAVKLEKANPAGSVKDRAALYMIKQAEKDGLLQEGGTIVEPTSGNTGIGLAQACAALNYKAVFTMPETMSVERQSLMRAYGAQLILTEGSKGMQGAVDKAAELCKTIEGAYMPLQFENKANAAAHYETTGPEIWRDTNGEIAAFVAGVGTGGTISGAGKYLKEQSGKIKIFAVEPAKSPLLNGGTAAGHKIMGIGANFVPTILDKTIYDEVIDITDEDAFAFARLLAKCEGILTGISSGAALCAAINVAKRNEFDGKLVVAILPDSGERYLSAGLFE